MSLMFLVTMMSALEPLVLFDGSLSDDPSQPRWRPVHDGVMGGVSSGGVDVGPQGVRFAGEVSLENNGGFASFRLDLADLDLTDRDALRLRVLGDGRTYKLGLRAGRSNVRWQASFETHADGSWNTVVLPLTSFVPTFRGRLVRDAGAFEPRELREAALLIADAQAGPFRLEVRSLEAITFEEREAPGSLGSYVERNRTLGSLVANERNAQAVRDALRWSERAVVLASPRQLDPPASRQFGALHARVEELAARELHCMWLMGNQGRFAGQELDERVVRALRDAWEAPADGWQLLLIGKDGGVKRRWSSRARVEEIFACIDAMPMRRSEVRARAQ